MAFFFALGRNQTQHKQLWIKSKTHTKKKDKKAASNSLWSPPSFINGRPCVVWQSSASYKRAEEMQSPRWLRIRHHMSCASNRCKRQKVPILSYPTSHLHSTKVNSISESRRKRLKVEANIGTCPLWNQAPYGTVILNARSWASSRTNVREPSKGTTESWSPLKIPIMCKLSKVFINSWVWNEHSCRGEE